MKCHDQRGNELHCPFMHPQNVQNPLFPSCFHFSPLAQLVEHRANNARVGGSSPSRTRLNFLERFEFVRWKGDVCVT